MKNDLIILGTITGMLSAVLWFWSAFARVTYEQAVERSKKRAAKRGKTLDLGGMVIGGDDLMATMKRQSTLNAAAAALSGVTVLLQTIASFIS